jgi:hypothetical protein
MPELVGLGIYQDLVWMGMNETFLCMDETKGLSL